MPELPELSALDKLLLDTPIKRNNSVYIGASAIGGECWRKIWYDFRGAYPRYITQQLQMTFNVGNVYEDIVVNMLRSIGVQIKHAGADQLRLIDDSGHVMGWPDGIATAVPGLPEDKEVLLEIKSANVKKWGEFRRFGVQRSSPTYYGQLQFCMKHTELDTALFLVINKNTQQLYHEFVLFDKSTAGELEDKAIDIISAEKPPPKLSEQAEYYMCRMCDAHAICHGGETLQRGCRTCQHVQIHVQGAWRCGRNTSWGDIPVKFQRVGCDAYIQMETA